MINSEIFLFWALISLVWGSIGAMAGYKKFSVIEGFIGGFFLWIFGIAIVYCSRKNVKQCPYCFMDIHKNATICPHCREHQPEEQKTA
jgi:hypothetical protein